MKKSIFLFLFAAVLTSTSCSKESDDSTNVTDATDEIIGTWATVITATTSNNVATVEREEYIFKANNTGDYSLTTDGEVDSETTFSWSKKGVNYIVNASGSSEESMFTIGTDANGNKILVNESGETVVTKE